jgi:TRAP-type mannitol/chloroaromatic compound transport system permease small subunit
MRALLVVSRGVDTVTATVGRCVYWLILAAVLVSAGNAVVRKLLGTSSNAWLELQWYLFAAVFMLAAAYTLQRNEHVRIDIVSNLLSKRGRNWIDVIGHVFFLLPFTVLMIRELLPWVIDGIRSGEVSANAGGLVLWPARSVVLAGFALLFFQAISELIKRIGVMRNLIPDPHERRDEPHVPVE